MVCGLNHPGSQLFNQYNCGLLDVQYNSGQKQKGRMVSPPWFRSQSFSNYYTCKSMCIEKAKAGAYVDRHSHVTES